LLKFIWLCGMLLRRGKRLILGQVVSELYLLPSAIEEMVLGASAHMGRVHQRCASFKQTTTSDFHP
jgi:hypothetical protein